MNQVYANNFGSSPTPDRNKVFATPQNHSSGSYLIQNSNQDTMFNNQNLLMQNNMNAIHSNEQSPVMMATFSKEKDRNFYMNN